MNVVRRGTPPEEVVWHGTCSTCHSAIEAQACEVKVYGGPDPRTEGPHATAPCPVCAHTMYFYPKN